MSRFMKQFEHLRIPLEEVKTATNSFDADNMIGRGGFGAVYKGEPLQSNGNTSGMVAAKRLDRKFGQGDPEFWTEIQVISNFKHENIVSLVGFCDENDEKILVYEFASKKSLDLHLASANLNWVQRLNICLGVARGFEYLHDPKGTHLRILHRDVKSSNILLDENWKPKITDFGLSTISVASEQFSIVPSQAIGTVGYCDPLYIKGFLSKESDVYSFGMVLFEVLSGKLCFTYKDGQASSSLLREIRKCVKQNKLNEIIFDGIKDEINPDSLKAFVTIAYQCLKKIDEERPTMSQIVNELENALGIQLEVAIRRDLGKLLFGCSHYRNRCKLRAPCCNRIFPCHCCHDEHTSQLSDPNERHKMICNDVNQMVCTICHTEQPAEQICRKCGVKMGEYFCRVCKLYDDDTSKQQFHCDDCGICRINHCSICSNSFTSINDNLGRVRLQGS